MNVEKACTILAGVMLAIVARGEDKPAPRIVSAHFHISNETIKGGQITNQEGEVWYRVTEERSEWVEVGGKSVVLIIGDTWYGWQIGSPHVTRMNLGPNVGPMNMYAKGLQFDKSKAKKVREEKVGDVACDVYEEQYPGVTRTTWVSKASQLTVKFVMEMNAQGVPPNSKLTCVFKNVEINPKLGDGLFLLPEGVTWIDLK